MGEVTPKLICGTDFSEGSDVILHPPQPTWPPNASYHTEGWFQLLEINGVPFNGQYFCSNQVPLSEHIQTRIIPADGDRALYQEVTRVDFGDSVLTRNQFLWRTPDQQLGVGGYRQEFYLKCRMKFQPDLVERLSVMPNGHWHGVLGFHNHFRLAILIRMNTPGRFSIPADGKLHWTLEKNPQLPHATPQQDGGWREVSSEPVPVNEWFDLEFWARPETTFGAGDGLAAVAINKVPILLRTTGVYFGESGFGWFHPLKIYEGIDSLTLGPAYQWISSFELWHGWPNEPV